MGTIRLFIGGDLCLCGPVKGDILTADADLRIINLEGPVTGARRKTLAKPGVYGNLRQHNDIEKIMTRDRWDVALLANNHITDFGQEGLEDTLSFLDKRGIAHLGAGIGFENAYRPLIIEKNGVKVGLVNGAEGQIGCMKNAESAYGYAWLLHTEMTKTIARLRAECDLVIVLSHAGLEFFDLPLPEWREIYRSFIDAGADAVVATHTHVVQGRETYKGKPIYYSLGNFFFNLPSANDPEWFSGMGVTLTFDAERRTVNSEENFFSFDNDRMVLQPSFAARFAERSALLSEERKKEYLTRVNDHCGDLWRTRYRPPLSFGPLSLLKKIRRMIINRSMKDGGLLLYNFMTTESHRFAIERALRRDLFDESA
ncbi:MAG TPA: CapA family protein [bacterium]|nr:CapA family protein [bacterium]